MPDADVGRRLGRDGRARAGGPALVQGDRDRRHDHRADGHARDRQISGYRGPDFLGQGRAAAGDQHHRIRLHRGRRQEGRRGRQDTAWAERARRPLRRRIARLSARSEAGRLQAGAAVDQRTRQIHRHDRASRQWRLRRRRRSMARRRSLAIFAGFRARATGSEFPASRRDLQHRYAQRRAERRHRRGDHAGVEGLRPVGARDQGRQADDRLLRSPPATVKAMPATCSMSPSRGGDRNFECFVYQPIAGRPLCLHDREGCHA